MIGSCADLVGKIRANHDYLLSTLQGSVSIHDSGADQYTRQQLVTALRLLEIMLAARGADAAGRHFAAWLKIARAQTPTRYLEPKEFSIGVCKLESLWAGKLCVVAQEERETLAEVFAAARGVMGANAPRVVRGLFIGDCLVWDACLQLQLLGYAEGLVIEPTILAQRVGADLRREIAKRRGDEFDLAVYSPYSFEFSSEYAFASSTLNLIRAPGRVAKAVRESLADVAKTLEVLSAQSQKLIYVHTASGARQWHSGWRGFSGFLANAPAALLVRRRLNRQLSALVEQAARVRARPILRIHEERAGQGASLLNLGRVLYEAGELHPTRLAAGLARGDYLRAARVSAHLEGKKLVVCDLDDTLWAGAIGEGTVSHHADRQLVLSDLRARGIVLAIASKNDPGNVSWRGGTLSANDFVVQMINWAPKAANIQTIAERLNLNPSSFVFLDDRPDERAMALAAMPGLVALDPNEPETWLMLREWCESLPQSSLGDRTKIYRERAEREEFLNSIAASSDAVSESFNSLGLLLSLRRPRPNEISRVVDLINRTNQFNTSNARVTRQEMERIYDRQLIIIADIKDKFGDMGIVGVLAIELGPTRNITHFVLSCRVFGFGVEDAMLNSMKRRLGDERPTYATIVETPVNGPCRDVFKRNGFERQGENWVFLRAAEIIDQPWLEITDDINDKEAHPGALANK